MPKTLAVRTRHEVCLQAGWSFLGSVHRSLVEKTKQKNDKNDVYGGLILGFMVVFFLVSPCLNGMFL